MSLKPRDSDISSSRSLSNIWIRSSSSVISTTLFENFLIIAFQNFCSLSPIISPLRSSIFGFSINLCCEKSALPEYLAPKISCSFELNFSTNTAVFFYMFNKNMKIRQEKNDQKKSGFIHFSKLNYIFCRAHLMLWNSPAVFIFIKIKIRHMKFWQIVMWVEQVFLNEITIFISIKNFMGCFPKMVFQFWSESPKNKKSSFYFPPSFRKFFFVNLNTLILTIWPTLVY